MTPGLSQIAVMKVIEIKSYDRKTLDRKDTFFEICSQLLPEMQLQNTPNITISASISNYYSQIPPNEQQ